jgi:hypothetical protein
MQDAQPSVIYNKAVVLGYYTGYRSLVLRFLGTKRSRSGAW